MVSPNICVYRGIQETLVAERKIADAGSFAAYSNPPTTYEGLLIRYGWKICPSNTMRSSMGKSERFFTATSVGDAIRSISVSGKILTETLV